MQTIPLEAVPNQSLRTLLGAQDCTIRLRTLTTGLYMDLFVGSLPMKTGVLCCDRTLIVRYPYLGFSGDLAFMDTQGTENPAYSGLGVRWVLNYLAPADL
jgi:hypothetical protein